MEKKTVVTTIRGYQIKVAAHMLDDLAKFGATQLKPTLKPAPKELLTKVIAKEVSPLPVMEVTEPVNNVVNVPVFQEPKVRKTPVRSKAKK